MSKAAKTKEQSKLNKKRYEARLISEAINHKVIKKMLFTTDYKEQQKLRSESWKVIEKLNNELINKHF